MSSVASQRAMLIALGGMSIAALFIWYVQSQKNDEEKKKKKAAVSEPPIEVSSVTPVACEKKTEAPPAEPTPEASPSGVTSSDCDREMGCIGAAGDSAGLTSEEPPFEEAKCQLMGPSGDYVKHEEAQDVDETESQHEESSGGPVSEGDYDIEEQVICEKASELMLDISHNPTEHEQFSWSEEMERCYVEQQQMEQSKIDSNERYAQSESPGVASDNSESNGGNKRIQRLVHQSQVQRISAESQRL